MKLDHYRPAKNILLLKEVLVKTSGNIMLAEEQSAGYYEVLKTGPLCEKTSPGDFIVSTLQQGIEIQFEEGTFMQLPEFGVDGYYKPTKEELKKPVPVFGNNPEEEEEGFNIIDSEGGNNELGTEFGERDN